MTSLVHIGCGSSYHSEYDIVTVVNFAAALKPRPSNVPRNWISNSSKKLTREDPGLENSGKFIELSRPSRHSGHIGNKHGVSKESTFKDNPEITEEDERDNDEESNFDEDENNENEWPEGALKMKEEKSQERRGDKIYTRVKRKFRMEDGTQVTKEYVTVEKAAHY